MKNSPSRKSTPRINNRIGFEPLEPRRLFSGSVAADVLHLSAPAPQPHTSANGIIFNDATPASTFLSASPLQFSGNTATLTITNSSSETNATLKWIYLAYPQKNGSITRIDMGDATIFDSSFPGPTVIIGSFQGTSADRTLPAGSSTTLTFFFSKKADAHANLYSMDLNFGSTAGAVKINL